MKKIKLISALLIGVLSFSLVSCGGTTEEIAKEEAFTTIPEQQLATEYLTEYLQGGDELYQDGKKFYLLYWADEVDKDFMAKYDLKQFEGEYRTEDIYEVNSKLYSIAANLSRHGGISAETNEFVFANEGLMPMVQNYLSDVWKNETDGEYKLSPEFEEKNPKKQFQKYLKENKIEITEIVYPTQANGLKAIAGATVMNVPVTLKGTQDGEEFTKDMNLDFYFVVNNNLRKGISEEVKPENFEIMGVNLSSDKKELTGFNYEFSYENALSDFGIK